MDMQERRRSSRLVDIDVIYFCVSVMDKSEGLSSLGGTVAR